MKYFFLFVLLIFVFCDKNEEKNNIGNDNFIRKKLILSEIDQIKTKEEVQQLIRQIDTNYKKYEVKTLSDFEYDTSQDKLTYLLLKKLNINSTFTKTDFDNNGFSDILVIGDSKTCEDESKPCHFMPILIMNFDENYQIIRINDDISDNMFLPKIEYFNNQPFLTIYQEKQIEWKKYQETKTILTYQFGNLIEFNANPKARKISKIQFSTSGCFGTCPIFELSLNKDSISVFKAIKFNFSNGDFYKVLTVEEQIVASEKVEGIFVQNISSKEFDKLVEIINYCDFENLKDSYNVWHTCDTTGDLKITYDDGKTKIIGDYGMAGTYGLKLLYNKLLEFRFNEKWIAK